MTGKARDDGPDGLSIHRITRKGAVEIDDVEVRRALACEQHRLRRRIIAIDRRAGHIALCQANNLALLKVDGGKDDQAHGRHFIKRSSSARP